MLQLVTKLSAPCCYAFSPSPKTMSLVSQFTFALIVLLTVVLFDGILSLLMKRGGRRGLAGGREARMLRLPGEGRWERLEQVRDQLQMELLDGLCVPLVVAGVPALIVMALPPGVARAILLALIGTGYVVSIGYRGWRIMGLMRELRGLKADLRAERLVADQLLTAAGGAFHVFHDAVLPGPQKQYHIDHLVVGPTGVYAIETKTHERKADAMTGGAERVAFNGTVLEWPTGQDAESPQEAATQAERVQTYLHERLGLAVPVQPVLALPGWQVDGTGQSAVAVVNPRQFPSLLFGRPVLDGRTIDAVRRQFDTLCRNVPCEV